MFVCGMSSNNLKPPQTTQVGDRAQVNPRRTLRVAPERVYLGAWDVNHLLKHTFLAERVRDKKVCFTTTAARLPLSHYMRRW
jgi:hypothetical protein